MVHLPRHGDDPVARQDVRGVLGLGEVVLDDRRRHLEQLFGHKRDMSATQGDRQTHTPPAGVHSSRRGDTYVYLHSRTWIAPKPPQKVDDIINPLEKTSTRTFSSCTPTAQRPTMLVFLTPPTAVDLPGKKVTRPLFPQSPRTTPHLSIHHVGAGPSAV